jgi:hypothetical protein
MRKILMDADARHAVIGPIADADLADVLHNIVHYAAGQQQSGPWGSPEWRDPTVDRFLPGIRGRRVSVTGQHYCSRSPSRRRHEMECAVPCSHPLTRAGIRQALGLESLEPAIGGPQWRSWLCSPGERLTRTDSSRIRVHPADEEGIDVRATALESVTLMMRCRRCRRRQRPRTTHQRFTAGEPPE